MSIKEEVLLEQIAEDLANREPISLDLSDVLAAIRNLPRSASAEEIAVAIAAHLHIPEPQDVTTALEELSAQISRLADRPLGAVTGSGGGGRTFIKNDSDHPVPVALVSGELGESSGLTDDELRATPVPVSIEGNVEIGTSVEIANDTGNPVPVNGTVALDAGTLSALENTTVTVDFPDTQPVTGTVEVSNFPATQPISGTVTVNEPVTVDATDLDIRNLDSSTDSVAVSGTVSVTEPVTVDGAVSVSNFPATQTVALDAASLAALESITAVISGAIALDAPTLAALETIGLDAATLTALENVVVSGEVSLSAATLTALETITAVISGDVSLSAGTLAALETIELGATTLAALETIELGATTLAALETISIGTALPAGTNAIGKLAANDGVDIGDVSVNNFPATQAVTGTFWQATQPVSGTVTANAGTGTMATKEVRSATPSQSSVGDSATSVTLISSNANRLGATIYNDSSAVLYVKLGATASNSSFTVLLAGNGTGIGGYYEVPYGYTGVVDGIWASDAGGNARITELAS